MKRIVFFSGLIALSMIAQPLFSQRNRSDAVPATSFNVERITQNKALTADFVSVDRFGEVPLTVQFKDASDGEPETWFWNFGDGTTDSVENPVHTYNLAGSYTVKLTVTAGGEVSSVTREGYINTVSPGNCDTAAYPLPGEYTYYIIFSNGSGYVSGNNSYGDLAKASYFDESQEGYLLGGIFDFAVAKKSLTSDPGIKFHAWSAEGPQSSPGTILDTREIALSEIVRDVEWERSTLAFFDEPVALDGPFFLGVELPQNPGDTIALFTNEDGQGNPANGWEQHSSGNWYPYTDAQSSWNLMIDHAIFPVICESTGIDNQLLDQHFMIYPVPADDRLFITAHDYPVQNMQLTLFDISGRQLAGKSIKGSGMGYLNVGHLHNGVYILHIMFDDKTAHRKVLISR